MAQTNPRITYKTLNKEKPKIIIFRLSKRNISLIEIKIILYLKVNLLNVYFRNKNTYKKIREYTDYKLNKYFKYDLII